MSFEIIGKTEQIEMMASGKGIHDLRRLEKQYGRRKWRKLKGVAPVRLRNGRIQSRTALIQNEYRYYKRFDELLPENNHLVVIVIFKTNLDEHGKYIPNNFVVAGWAKYIRPKRWADE